MSRNFDHFKTCLISAFQCLQLIRNVLSPSLVHSQMIKIILKSERRDRGDLSSWSTVDQNANPPTISHSGKMDRRVEVVEQKKRKREETGGKKKRKKTQPKKGSRKGRALRNSAEESGDEQLPS